MNKTCSFASRGVPAHAQSSRDLAHPLHAGRVCLPDFWLLWWYASGRLVDRLFVSDPIAVAHTLFEVVLDGTLWWHLRQTLIEMALGYVLGVSIGISLAVVVSSLPWGQSIMRPLMLSLFAVPKVSLAPVVIVWLGIYLAPKIAPIRVARDFHRLFQHHCGHRFGQS